MPILESAYQPGLLHRQAHLSTIVPNKLRKVSGVSYQRERIELSDGDFVDLDFSSIGSDTLVIILHGLEGNSDRAYAKGMVKMAHSSSWDAAVFNQRGCSGEANRLLSAYHSGKSEDLHEVIQLILKTNGYSKIMLVGFSLGGNITLKYLGENPWRVPREIVRAVAISVPIHLESSAYELAKRKNWVYMHRFLKTLKAKTIEKISRFPDCGMSVDEVRSCRNFIDFDNLYTAPIHGFKNAQDYWTQCSSKQFLNDIKVPTLLINAQNDPFLSPECFPTEVAEKSHTLHLLSPKHGGHVGFGGATKNGMTWAEVQTAIFLKR